MRQKTRDLRTEIVYESGTEFTSKAVFWGVKKKGEAEFYSTGKTHTERVLRKS